MSAARPDAPKLWPLVAVLAGASVAIFELARPAKERAPEPASGASLAAPSVVPGASLDCPSDQLPDDGVCIPVPPVEAAAAQAPAPIVLLPGRAPDYTRYVTPIAAYPAAPAPRGSGLFVAAPRGVPVTAISLEAQVGPTRRWVTASTPPRLLTLHRVERAGAARTYVLAYDGLSFDTLPGLNDVAVGTPLGRVAGRPGITGLALAARQVRRGVDAESLAPERLLLDSSSLDCDVRNVLPPKPAP